MGEKASKKPRFYRSFYQPLTSPLAAISEKSGTLGGNDCPFLPPISTISSPQVELDT